MPADIPLDLEDPSRPAKAKKPPPPKPTAPSAEMFAGITAGPAGDCCNDCSVDLCMITMIGFCGHPSKGALQAELQRRPEVVARRRFAKRMLDDMVLEARKD